jgi:hypothetical protein
MTTILLGPQRFQTTAGTALRSLKVDGPVATITAGWEEREDLDAELNSVLDGRGRNLRLYHRLFDVLDKDPVFAAAALAFRDRHEELRDFYGVRLRSAVAAVDAVQRRSSLHGIRDAAVEDALGAVREVDAWYSVQLKGLYREFDAQSPISGSGVIGWHRGELAAMLGDCAALVITGGHVGALLRALRLFALPIPEELPVIAWSAGAMALTDKVVLFHDFAPHGVHEAEVYDRGLGRVPGVIALPHARRRLRLEDRRRSAMLAQRFPESRCLLLDDGTAMTFPPGSVAGSALPTGARVLGADGQISRVGAA